MSKKLSLEYYISKAIEINGTNYDYSLISKIKTCKEKLPIKCNINKHGIFYQDMDHHINRKSGCPRCSIEKTHNKLKLTMEEFNNIANAIYGIGTYNYSKFIYINNLTPGIITCNTHKIDFLKSPSNHIKKNNPQGCPLCGYERCSIVQKKSKDVFEMESNLIHNYKYNYEKFIYINNNTKGIIICPIHGDFNQTPIIHLCTESGCPRCNDSHGERISEQFLVDKNIKYERQIKFNNCRNPKTNYPLKYDFGVFKDSGNLLCLIEIDGEYHFSIKTLKEWKVKIPSFYSTKIYKENNFRDNIKTSYCKDNNIPLLRIPFWNTHTNKATTKEDIETSIKNFINSLVKV
jgi:hypothetical protein